MEEIIQQIVEKYKEILEKGLKEAIKSKEFSKFSKSVKEFSDNLGKDLLEEIMKTVDRIIYEDKKRKQEFETISIRERKIVTLSGKTKFERRYYEEIETGEKHYLTDEIMGIQKRERIDKNVTAKVIEYAGDESYSKSGKKVVANEEISSTTVMKNVRKQDLIVKQEELEEKKEVEYLYIQADEDHYKEIKKGSSISKIITIFEGKKVVSKNKKRGSQIRKELVEKFTIAGVYNRSEEMWLEAAKYVDSKYNLEKIKKVYIAGDGASWIKEGINWIAKSVFVLDEFHMQEYILKIKFDEEKMRYLKEAVGEFDAVSVENILTVLEEEIKEEIKKREMEGREVKSLKTKLKKATEVKRYLLNQWSGIEIYQTDRETIMGCCQEGQVSHILSERLSTRPMEWSKEGADKMSKIRAFKENKGNIYEALIEISREEKRNKRIEQLEKRVNKKIGKRMFGTRGVSIAELEGARDELYYEIKNIIAS